LLISKSLIINDYNTGSSLEHEIIFITQRDSILPYNQDIFINNLFYFNFNKVFIDFVNTIFLENKLFILIVNILIKLNLFYHPVLKTISKIPCFLYYYFLIY
jgi:hypothetical protein